MSRLKSIRIAMADDHTIFRTTVINMLSDENNFSIIFDTANGRDLIDELRRREVDVVVLDLDMPIMDGRDALKTIHKKYPGIKVVVLSLHYTNVHIEKYLGLGANAYLSKDCEYETLKEAINNVVEYGFHFDENVSLELVQRVLKDQKPVRKLLEYEPLTKREIEVLRLICNQKSGPEIANDLHISSRTVENHKEHLRKKTGAINNVGLLIFAIEHGFFELPI